MAIKHAFTSAVADGADTSVVRPSNWNANHVIDAGTITTTELGGDITTAGKALLDDASAAAQRTTLGLAAIAASGSGADLTAATVTYAKIQNVSATDKLLGRSTAGAGTVEEITCTAAGRAILDDANAAAQLTTLGVTAYAQTLLDDATAADARTTLGLAAVASSGSASDLGTGTLPAARIGSASIEDTKLATSANKGRFLARQIITATGTYTPTTGTCVVRLRAIGGGGGGGGAAPGAGAGAGAGGSSGVLLDIVLGTPGTALTGDTATCGTAGTAGANTGGAGGAGGDSTIPINGTTYTAKGGGGGNGSTGTATNGAALPTAPAAGTSAGGFTSYGLGGVGTVDDGTAWWSGNGGSTELGAGGLMVGGTTAGNNGNGMGGGGSGAAAQSGGRAGGAGATGGFVIDEYT